MAKKKKIKVSSKKTKLAAGKSNTKVNKDYSKIALPALLLLTLLVFFPSLKNGFVNWDDPTYVTENPYITSLSFENIKTFFLAGIHSSYPDGIAYNYHPITMFSLAINYSMSGLDASSYHITNLLLHIINIVLVFFLSKRLFKNANNIIPICIAAGFAIHPMHVESVAWVTERKDLLFTLFYILGMLFYLKSKEGNYKRFIGLSFFVFILSLLSKPSAVTFPIALFLLDYLNKRDFSKTLILEKIPFFIIAIIFGFITIGIQGDVAIGDFSNYSVLNRISFAFYGILFYLWNFILPWKAVTFYPFPNVAAMPILISIAPLIALGILFAIFYFFKKNRMVIFGFLFFLLNIALTLQLVQVGNSIVSDRYTYLSYFGLLVITGYFLNTILNKKAQYKPVVLGVLGMYLLYFSFSTFQQCKHWENGDTLWSRVIDRFPNSSSAYNNRANYFMKHDKLDLAVKDISKAYQINPKNVQVLTSHANIMRKTGKTKEALNSANTLIGINDAKSESYNTRGSIYFVQNNYVLAREDFEKALQLDSGNQAAYSNLGSIYFKEKNYAKAIEMYDKVLTDNPTMLDALINKGASQLSSGKNLDAIETLKKYISLKSDSHTAYYYLGLCYDRTNDNSSAIDHLTKAIQLSPNNKSYYAQRSSNYAKAGNIELSNADKKRASSM